MYAASMPPIKKKTVKTEKTERVNVRFSEQEIAIIDELRKNEPGIPGRPEMIRLLVRRAGAAKKEKAGH